MKVLETNVSGVKYTTAQMNKIKAIENQIKAEIEPITKPDVKRRSYVMRGNKAIFKNPSKYLLDQIKEVNSDEELYDA